jgi:signal transduction histidine kinase
VRVKDNGVGIDPTPEEKGREGYCRLQRMRKRAARIGGKVYVVTSGNTGTEVIVLAQDECY